MLQGRLGSIFDRSVVALGRTKALDPLATVLEALADRTVTPPLLRDALSGTWLGHPLHPLLVAVPIGSWVGASVLDVLGRRNDRLAARRLVGLGLVAAFPTALAGLSDWRYTAGPERRIGAAHALANYASLALYGASWCARRSGGDRAGATLALLGSGTLAAGGYLGGHLSYAHGVGVDTTAFQAPPDEWTPVADEGEVGGDALERVEAGGVAVLLAQVDGSLVAYGDRCSHRGGPLSEGRREDDCVRCPWHDSRFDLRDGSVTGGPATRPQPRYEVRTEGGRIEIRAGEQSALRSNSV